MILRAKSSSEERATQKPDEETKKNNYETFVEELNPTSLQFRTVETKPQDSMDPNDALEIIRKYGKLHFPEYKEENFNLVAAGITKLVQDGGTNQTKRSLTVNVGNANFDLGNLREVLKSIDRNLTVRKFAKGARDLIIKIALTNKWPGPLTKDLTRINPNLSITQEIAPWCNEIHSDNYKCPNEIRDALIRREEQFRILTTQREGKPKSQNVKPRSQRGRKRNR